MIILMIPKIFSDLFLAKFLDSLAKEARARARKTWTLNEWRLMNGNFLNGSSHLKAKFCHAPVDFVRIKLAIKSSRRFCVQNW